MSSLRDLVACGLVNVSEKDIHHLPFNRYTCPLRGLQLYSLCFMLYAFFKELRASKNTTPTDTSNIPIQYRK